MKKTTVDVKDIVLCGGSVILDATEYTISNLKDIALVCRSKGTTLILKNAKQKTTYDLKQLALLGCITFDLT
ncbi:hypothetical protein LZ906_006660 [Paraclostridium ghonii]|uniref:hypothetical protein n=1 Tax=Paraclostridium ghonii TaxID=29358 RepID=UPI00202CD162|nr:hypothetical protein [Paeniclostridium ghonii]MCM0166986.1 hypothetical protein [Paeniclostridium ghonii]